MDDSAPRTKRTAGMPRRIVEDSDDEDSDDRDPPAKRKPAPRAGKQKLSASALGKRPAVPAKQAKAKGRPKSKQLSDKELGIRGTKEVVVLSDDDDFDPDDDEEDEDDEDDDDDDSDTGDEETEEEEEDDDDSDDSDEDDGPRRSVKRQKAPKVELEASAASARRRAVQDKVSYKEPGLDDADILDDDEHSEDADEELKFADDDAVPLSQKASQAAPSSQPKAATKHAYAVGQQVEAKHQAQRVGSFAANWFGGVVRKVHGDGACDIDYDDGDEEDKVPLKFLRPPRKLNAQAEAPTQEPPLPKRGPGRPPAPKPPPQAPPNAEPPRKRLPEGSTRLPEGANVIELSDDDAPATPAEPGAARKSKGKAAAKGKGKAAASASRVAAPDDDVEEVLEEEEEDEDESGDDASRCVKGSGGRGGQRKKIRRVKSEAEVNDETRAALAAERERQRQVGRAQSHVHMHMHMHIALGRWAAPTAAATTRTRRRVRTSRTRRRAPCST